MINADARLRWIALVSRASEIVGQRAHYQGEYIEAVRQFARGIHWMASMPDKWIQDSRTLFDKIEYDAAEIIKAHETSTM